MKFKTLKYEGVNYLVPERFSFLPVSLKDYPSFCGAGEGIGDKVVPELIGGKKCSHICHIHDESWNASNSTFTDFMISNAMFLFNFAVYLFRDGSMWEKSWRMIKGFGYFLAVSTVGYRIFKKLKRSHKP